MKNIDLASLYKIEWTLDDNANAWIEPTTYCQLRCPKCFRDIGGVNHCPAHQDIKLVKQEILEIKKNRNVESITFGGGEPLLYPNLIEAIEFCKKNKIKVRICTNAINLDEQLLIRLKKAGTNEILIHLDMHQGRGSYSDIFELRKNYCDIFRKVPGVNLGFMTMINDVEEDLVGDMIDFYQKNVDIILLVSFIFTKDITIEKDQETINTDKFDHLISYINKRYKGAPSAYIGKIIDKNTPSWLIYLNLFCGTAPLGTIDGKMHGFFSRMYRILFRKHWFLTTKKTISFFNMLPFVYNKSIREILISFFIKNIKSGFKHKLNYQIITINFGPDKIHGRWDLCDSCPDAMYYNGKLVPSCLLERIKKGENITY